MTNYDIDERNRKDDEAKRDSAKAISDWVESQAEYHPEMVRLEPREYFDECVKGTVHRIKNIFNII